MSDNTYNPFADPAMLDLFRQEVESHSGTLTSGLLDLEKNPDDAEIADKLMRAAHSIKGAARMVGIDYVVKIAHAMEDCFVSAQKGAIKLTAACIDTLLKGIDTINDISNGKTDSINDDSVKALTDNLDQILNGQQPGQADTTPAPEPEPAQASTGSVDMLALFRDDARNVYRTIQAAIEENESDTCTDEQLEIFRSAVHTIRGSARLCDAMKINELCAALEDRISFWQDNNSIVSLRPGDALQVALATLFDALNSEDSDTGNEQLDIAIAALQDADDNKQPVAENPPEQKPLSQASPVEHKTDHSIRISTNRLNRLVGLAGESVVESRWVRNHADAMLVYKRRQTEIINALDNLRNYLDESTVAEHITELFGDIQKRANSARAYLGSRLSELDDYDRRITSLSERLNHEVLQTRMRPFADCTHGFDRMVRDLARSLDKRVELKITGENTQVDREILSRIEAPLNHILRNAIDHGIETTAERTAMGKAEQATIRIEAAHNMGMLSIIISDDGRGVDMQALRERILERKLASQNMVNSLSDNELLDFLYLPGFSTRSSVTEISGRGVGLDVVHSTIQEMRGQIRTSSETNKGIRIQLLLPLTLSVIRSLLVKIAGQAYAFPLARIDSIHTLERQHIETMEGKQYFTFNDRHIGLVDAAQVLEVTGDKNDSDEVHIIVLGDRNNMYGIVIDEFIGERDLAVHVLDNRLGKIRDISAATLLENGEPALIVDIEDMIRSIEILVSGERLAKIRRSIDLEQQTNRKRILVVDDSITVREVEKKLLESKGYEVEVAVDGMDGWNTVNNASYDLVISDIDMPRMNGIEFVTMLKQDPKLKVLPVMIVSYKDREEDRVAGLQAGADYYLTKGSFHDESLIDAVVDLIGSAEI